jgi:hypothetical protein
MRLLMLFTLLLVAACTIREESFSPRDNTDGALSFNAPYLNAPDVGDSGGCPGGFARNSQMQDSRDGTQELFCD